MAERNNDPRVVANFILKTRKHLGLDTTNLELQKILFFCHSNYLLARRERLMSGHFEAWDYGPVHPIVYRAFKGFGGNPIQHEAEGRDPFTKQPVYLDGIADFQQRQIITATVADLSKMNAFQLVELSHKKGGAWASTVSQAKAGGALGMRITDEMIVSCATRTKLVPYDSKARKTNNFSAEDEVRYYVEAPIAGYGSG
ncbi:DUF4065 domain-containing protein [Ruegeria sp. 2012CJ41-6]|uniref:DUF4065 domain-containing protein n=1 Tax=Ruegeria spongiae TaxID=2942209 RepID=A0ABT0Q0V4_9RHOB|nr:type II toxin-antitoxin system antitoxin SocA domain-containing protein [Ruegeria spongiae]MCL6283431.1 DUF4065 domain-containing protein [Ruegeria spongiae]